jgi:hypothetical protein
MRVRVIMMGLVLVFVSSSAFALIGTPTAGLEKGKWSVGANYTYSSQDLDKTKIDYDWSWVDYLPDGTVDDSASGSSSYKLEIRNLNTNLYYGRLGYGLMDQWEVYGQVGLADVKAESKSEGGTRWYGNNLDNELAWGLGTKYTFAKKGKIDWGAGLQLNWYSNSVSDCFSETTDYGEGYTETDTWEETTDIDTLGILVAVGPTIDMGGWKLYGGAVYQLLTASYDYDENGSWLGSDDYYGTWTDKDSGDYDSSSFGGYIGAQVGVYKNWNMAVELLGTNDGWGAGAGIEIPF